MKEWRGSSYILYLRYICYVFDKYNIRAIDTLVRAWLEAAWIRLWFQVNAALNTAWAALKIVVREADPPRLAES